MVDALPDWLPQQRWFGAKGREIHGVELVADRELVHGDPSLRHLLVAVDLGEETETYQLLVGCRQELPPRLAHVAIGSDDGAILYDAAHDNELTHVLLQMIRGGDDEAGLRFRHLPGVEIETDLTSIVMGAEQSNTSIVFGDSYILKLFRKVAPGLNPDLEITRALADTGTRAVVPPLGWMEVTEAGAADATTLGMLQPFLKSASEGWSLAVTSVRDLYAEADLHADEVGGDFAGESERLGAVTAEVHALLAEVLPSRIADEAENAATAKQMHERLDAALAVVPELAQFADGLRASYDALAGLKSGVPVQRIHGDFHLGQALRVDDGWKIIDFEGEPARPLSERVTLMSPLRDVAGMLRSFDYAARHLLAEQLAAPNLEYRATEWAERNIDAFCTGYARACGHDPRDDAVLLRAMELDKAVYEVVYEARNRPTWLAIPLGSIERLVR
ncbi:MAG: maltokinase [Frankiaceae bacterium]|nr:maltokinase [Frankiaceae bacterium]MDQ1698947.1 maltokinase [Frankiaceae bacterium]